MNEENKQAETTIKAKLSEASETLSGIQTAEQDLLLTDFIIKNIIVL